MWWERDVRLSWGYGLLYVHSHTYLNPNLRQFRGKAPLDEDDPFQARRRAHCTPDKRVGNCRLLHYLSVFVSENRENELFTRIGSSIKFFRIEWVW